MIEYNLSNNYMKVSHTNTLSWWGIEFKKMLLSIGDLTVEDAVKPKLTPGTYQLHVFIKGRQTRVYVFVYMNTCKCFVDTRYWLVKVF